VLHLPSTRSPGRVRYFVIAAARVADIKILPIFYPRSLTLCYDLQGNSTQGWAAMAINLNEARLEDLLAELERMRQWSPRVVSRLETLIRTGDDFALFRINPMRYAAERNLNASESLDLFLHGAKIGLFEMDWFIVCPSCGHITSSFQALEHIHPDFVCNNCFVVKTAHFDDYIQVAFTLSPQIRRLAYHEPNSLSINDYYLKYHMSQDIRPMPDGTSFMQYMLTFTRIIQWLTPDECLEFELDLEPGIFFIHDYHKNPQAVFLVGDEADSDVQQLYVRLHSRSCEIVDRPVFPMEFAYGEFQRQVPQVTQVKRGKTRVRVENKINENSPVWILNFPLESGSMSVEFEPYVSGKHILTSQTFRTLFRTETVASEEGIGVKDLTLLFTDLKGSTAMYDEVGDPKAYYLVRQHFEILGKVIAEFKGAIVKTIGDAVMAAFMTPTDAVQAALTMLRDMQTFNQTTSKPLHLKVGIHRGHSIAVTLNERLDYFGQTVNIAARVQGLADADEIYVTDAVYNAPGMSSILAACEVSPEQVSVKGVSDTLRVHKLRLKPE
jgi:class 3 adenylate cyclase